MTTTLITGATRGLGRETARRLIEVGHVVYLGARDPAAGHRAADELGARSVVIDVTDDESIAAAVVRLTAEVDQLDVLINNAGIAGDQRPPAEADLADLIRVFDTNVYGPTRMLTAFTPLLEASAAPVVVNVSSAVGSFTRNSDPSGRWSLLAYPMSKAALNMLTVQYAKAFPRWRVNAVTPGLTATDSPRPRVPVGRSRRARASSFGWPRSDPTGLPPPSPKRPAPFPGKDDWRPVAGQHGFRPRVQPPVG